MKNNVFLIQTPFQFFNALEAKNRFHSEDKNTFIFIDKGNEKNRKQIQLIAQHEKIDSMICIDFSTWWQKLFFVFLIKSILKGLGTIDSIYVALFRNISAHIINTLKPKNVIIFDDGNRTLKVVHAFFVRNEGRKKESRRFFDALFFKKTQLDFIYSANFFSIYSEIEKYVPHFVLNDYRYFIASQSDMEIKNNIYIIGSKLIGEIMSEECFKSLLHVMVKYIQSKNAHAVYIPHRYEDVKYLENLSKYMNLTVCSMPTIIEYSLKLMKEKPKEIITIRSTAVDTLSRLYDIPVTIFQLDKTMIFSSNLAEIDTLYQYYARKNYQKVKVNEDFSIR